MDKRFNTLKIPGQLDLRRQAVDDVLAPSEWSLPQAVRHLKKPMRLTTAEMAKLSGIAYRTMLYLSANKCTLRCGENESISPNGLLI